MECQRVREAMYWVTDNELDAELLVPLRQHLTFCPVCAQQFAYVSKLLAVVRGGCCRQPAPSSLKERILASFPHRSGAFRLGPLE